MNCTGTRHGNINAARHHGCICPTALAEYRRYGAASKRRRYWAGQPLVVDPTGATRRVQALARAGWSFRAVADHAGLSLTTISAFASGQRTVIRRDNAEAIAAVYEELNCEDGPSTRQRAVALRNGWLGPERWPGDSIDDPEALPVLALPPSEDIDEVAVERACNGGKVTLADAERREVVRRLNGRGLNDAEIAERLHERRQAVAYLRARLGLPSATARRDAQLAGVA